MHHQTYLPTYSDTVAACTGAIGGAGPRDRTPDQSYLCPWPMAHGPCALPCHVDMASIPRNHACLTRTRLRQGKGLEAFARMIISHCRVVVCGRQ